MFPASKAIKKELFPIIDRSGKAKPVILAIVEEAVASGIETIAIVVQDRDRGIFEDFFFNPLFTENYNKLTKEDQGYSKILIETGHHISLVTQKEQEGFGHAVYCTREWVNEEPFILMLGDHLYASATEKPCTRQLLDVYEKYNTNIVGLKIIDQKELKRFGCVTGQWYEKGTILNITEIIEKPSAKIFHILEDHIKHNIREGGEFQLTSCLDHLRQEDGFIGYVLKGRSFDVGVPDTYRQTMIEINK
jgi:UTP--glucose-1-phosphate uridylyltransferase